MKHNKENIRVVCDFCGKYFNVHAKTKTENLKKIYYFSCPKCGAEFKFNEEPIFSDLRSKADGSVIK